MLLGRLRKRPGKLKKQDRSRERWDIVCCAKGWKCHYKKSRKALKHGVSAIGNVIKNPIKTIKHGVGALVHGGKALLTNRVKCNGHVWGHLGGTDIQTDIYFSPGPKLAIRDSKVSIQNLHVDWKFDKLCGHAAGLGSILVGGKKKL